MSSQLNSRLEPGEAFIELRSVDCRLSLAEIYDKVEFTSP